MNDNEPPLYMDDPPQWVWDILEKYDLELRADCPQAAVVVLLTDAAELLREASRTAFGEQAVTPALRQRITDIKTMIVDAEKLYPLCPTTPDAGIVMEGDDGTLTRSPA